jgi:hypothetical protein
VTLDAPRKGLQNLFDIQSLWINVKEFIKLYLQKVFHILVYHIKITIFFEQTHSKHFIAYSLSKEEFK